MITYEWRLRLCGPFRISCRGCAEAGQIVLPSGYCTSSWKMTRSLYNNKSLHSSLRKRATPESPSSSQSSGQYMKLLMDSEMQSNLIKISPNFAETEQLVRRTSYTISSSARPCWHSLPPCPATPEKEPRNTARSVEKNSECKCYDMRALWNPYLLQSNGEFHAILTFIVLSSMTSIIWFTRPSRRSRDPPLIPQL